MAGTSETEPTVLGAETSESQWTASERHWARKRLQKKREFRGDVVSYVVINGFLTGIWAVSGFGYFWPAWIMVPWAVFLWLDAWHLYYRRPITDDDIDRELRNRGQRDPEDLRERHPWWWWC